MKKIFLSAAICFGSLGLMAQNSFVSNGTGTSNTSTVTIHDLLDRLNTIGTTAGSVGDYFTPSEQRMLNRHFNPNQAFAPVEVTQSNSMTIEPGAGIACADGISYKNNSLYRVFDLAGDFGITNGLEVNTVQFGLSEETSTPGSFPVFVNIYAIDNVSDFPANYATMTLVGSGTYEATNADAGMLVDAAVSATVPAGKVMVVELKLVDDGTATNMTRFACNHDGETGPAYIMSDECGVPTPLPFGDLGLTNNLIMKVFGDDEPGGGSGVTIAYGIDNASYNLFEFDPADPSLFTDIGVSPIGPGGNFENAGAVDPSDNTTAYVLSNDNKFYSVDMTTGVYTQLGTIAPTGGGSTTWAGAEFNPVDGELYAITTDVTNSYLYKIDIGGLTATQIGLTGMQGAISLMINGAGEAFSHDIVDDTLYSIDLTTGVATAIGPLPFDANYGQGGTWIEGDNDAVYLSAFNNGAFQSEWWRIETFDGNGTLIGPFLRGSDLMQVGWSSSNLEAMGTADQTVSQFKFYPNPVTDVISLRAEKNIQSVVFYNIAGQKVQSTKADSGSMDVNLSNLKPGLYIMSVTIDGKVSNHKILKK